ncbi:hypothetical protein PVL29_020218 [Vitis rotundifolia]|uniref:Uncharacterized protein n=1 Tax=Vitis rotundifolia TaxID=103349 RepID=A0AA39DEZ0_VITRO|nr:hypothetical protein PVL29_020218 [Vitis rotundifolia]
MWYPKLIFPLFFLVFWATKQSVDVVATEEEAKLSFNVLRNREILSFSSCVSVRDFPSCFGENGVQVVHFTSSSCLCKFDIKSWLFAKRKWSKSFEINSIQVDTYWDLSLAKFKSGLESLKGFYLTVVFNGEMVLFLTDMRKEAFKKTNVTLDFYNVIFKLYGIKAQFWDNDQNHNLSIECDTISADNPFLVIRIDMFGLMVGNAIFIFQTCSSNDKLFDFLLSFLIFCNNESCGLGYLFMYVNFHNLHKTLECNYYQVNYEQT